MKIIGTPRTAKAAFRTAFGDTYVVNTDFARQLERENKNLRRLLDKASQAISCFVDLRGMTASELKSAHNSICILLNATQMLNEIKAEVEEGE